MFVSFQPFWLCLHYWSTLVWAKVASNSTEFCIFCCFSNYLLTNRFRVFVVDGDSQSPAGNQLCSGVHLYTVFKLLMSSLFPLCCLCFARIPQLIHQQVHDNSISYLNVTYLFPFLLILLVTFDLSSHPWDLYNCTKIYHPKLHQWGKRFWLLVCQLLVRPWHFILILPLCSWNCLQQLFFGVGSYGVCFLI